MKIYCVIDSYRNGRFINFVDFDSDTKFIEYLYRYHYDHFTEIINALYKTNDSDYDCGVNYFSYLTGTDHIRFEFRISRRFDYLLPFEENEDLEDSYG